MERKKRDREKNRGEGGGGRETDRQTEAVLPDEQTMSRSEHPYYGLRHIISNIPIPQGVPGLGWTLSGL